MMQKPILEFSAPIQQEKHAFFVAIPFDVPSTFGKKAIKIVATFDGIVYRGLLKRMGSPDYFLFLRKDIKTQLGKNVGESVFVTLQEDLEPRIVEIPSDLQALLDKNCEAAIFFKELSFTHQKEYVQWILESKRPETRQTRLEKTIALLLNQQKTH